MKLNLKKKNVKMLSKNANAIGHAQTAAIAGGAFALPGKGHANTVPEIYCVAPSSDVCNQYFSLPCHHESDVTHCRPSALACI
ncbi:hypothetical protein [Pseudoalteromonas luteoviolacea]|uniref:Uncharacterized protein n=2 Tax=Pseudoalteromonas luteoviolacea TaxID=43657 RepID=A0A162C777_9GAMM|nr:hypothetical protein [Pseudoalteromonas luteoviolacea]AOT10075.1 hypothetical protein S4054249_20650 [Pseudoalteromonas luteoviolacea]AOT14986.1 hypothetical protein S40542_20615 [Pseudoalteromonas luteoviolacea]AOT19903.1 hypothetical protein S4054_20625 [Pseudoalteromonas luteoviolacea]KKE84834.1 hypothetical protein N479_06985 [Pseudoalteromonas luteoviolacea S4054]KZN63293.1 hypothetical protein N473_17850 [Pseudoalteromonas luteoviolacea CPMOR-1]